jgi:3-oxoacyl-[acyl-carrier protein] reductase
VDLGLTGKVGIVTGASRGIGRAIAEGLSAAGMRLALVARSRELLEEVAATLPVETLVQAVDLREPQAPAAVMAAVVEQFGGLDVLVNNAGAAKRGDFLTLPDTDWEDGFALKFYGAMRCSRAAWPYLQRSGGAIVNIIGVGGRTGSAEFAIGGAVNAACLNLTKCLADRGVKDGIRVKAINPGSIATERLHSRVRTFATEHGLDETAAATEMAHAMRIARFGEAAEIAHVATFLASPRASYCQGVVMDVDGGLTRTL